MNKDKLTNGIILVLIIGLLAIVACTDKTPTGNVAANEKVQEIKIGAIHPLTGDIAILGKPAQEAMELAVSEVNRNGGINGKKLTIVYEDGACAPKQAANAANKLINIDNVKAIISFCSGETLAAAPITEQNKVILFSPSSGSPDVTTAGDYVFRNFPSDASSASKVAKAAIQNGHTEIVIISEQTDYAQSVAKVFRKTYTENGGEILADETFLPDTNDLRTQLTKMKNEKAEAVYLVAVSTSKYALALKQMKELGFNHQLYTNELASTEDFLKNYAEEIEGAIFAEPAFDETFPETKKFMDLYRAEKGEFGGALPISYHATAYDAVKILAESMQKCGEDTDCIKEHLYSIKNREGAAGILSIDSNGDAELEYFLKKIENNKPVEID